MEIKDAAADEAFSYKALDETEPEIRLVKLRWAPWDTAIECEIFHVSVADSPKYDALSYVWGSPDNKANIKLNGKDFLVTQNLAIALRYIRQFTYKDPVLWIDAICIDQQNDAERTDQVRQMGRIYKNAGLVFAWLGETAEDSDQAIELLHEIKKIHNASAPLSEPLSPEILRSRGFDADSKDWAPLWRLWSRPYWTRMWIIQEQLLAGDSSEAVGDRCVIGVGQSWQPRVLYKIGWSFVVRCMLNSDTFYNNWDAIFKDKSLRSEPLRSLMDFPDLPGRWFQSALMSAEGLSLGDNRGGLKYLLRSTRRFDCSDDRDRVFALVGLFAPDHVAEIIDYSRSFQSALQKTVEYSIATYGNLSILEGNRRILSEKQATWLPDNRSWHAPSGEAWDGQEHACGSLSVEKCNIDHEKGLLRIRGILIGVVNHVQGPFTSETDEERTRVIIEARKYHDSLPSPRKDDVWRTLVFDQDRRRDGHVMKPAPESFRELFEYAMLAKIPVGFEPHLGETARRSAYAEESYARLEPWRRNTDVVMSNHCFFDTDAEFMGMGPNMTAIGDCVVVLEGGAFCFVLRPYRSHYQVLGESWVMSAMDGQFVKNDDNGGIVGLQEFVLC